MPSIRRGVSFLEVTIVILIVGLLAAVGTPHFSRAGRMRAVRNAAIELTGYVDYVRSVSVNEGRSVELAIDADKDLFYSPDVDFPDRIGTPISVLLKERFDPSIEIKASFDGSSSMAFDFEGNPNVGGTPMTSGVINILSYGEGYQIVLSTGHASATITPLDDDSVVVPAPDIVAEPKDVELGNVILNDNNKL